MGTSKQGFLKIDVDAAISMRKKASGAVVRWAGSKSSPRYPVPRVGEAAAILEGLILARALNFRHAILESEAEAIIKCCSDSRVQYCMAFEEFFFIL